MVMQANTSNNTTENLLHPTLARCVRRIGTHSSREIRMTKHETRNKSEWRSPIRRQAAGEPNRGAGLFVIPVSDLIRHSGFDIRI
jgi:hypothetical protein